MDAIRALVNGLLLVPGGRFYPKYFYSTLGYRINQVTKVSFRFDNAVTTMDGLSGPFAGRLNVVTTAETLTLDRELTSRQKLAASYSFLHGTPLNPESGGSPSNAHLVNLGYTYAINPGLLVHLPAGVVEAS